MAKGSALKEFLFKAGKVAGVEITALPDSGFIYSIQIVEKKGNSLIPKESYNNIIDKQQFLKILKDIKLPVVINYQGKGIITRAFQDSIKNNFSEALNRVVPAGNENDFHIQLYNGNAGNSFVSILRKQNIQELLTEFTENKLDVTGVLLGNYHLELVLPLMPQGGSINSIKLNSQELIFEDGSLREIKGLDSNTEPFTIEIDKKQISSQLLPSMAAAMYYFINTGRITHNNKNIESLKKEFESKKGFVKLSRALIGFLLVITLGNFFLFNSYYKQLLNLDSELAVYESSLDQYELLKKQFESKTDFIEKSGLQSGSKFSFFSDRILYDTPDEVQLNYFFVAPAINKTERDSVIRFDTKKIIIKGSCTKSIVLNEWIKLIKSKDFVQDVILENYNQESEKLNGKFDISIKLK